jgi:hypothetical protein
MTSQEDKLAKLVDLMEESPDKKNHADQDMRELQALRQALLRAEQNQTTRNFNQSLHDKIMAEIGSEIPQARWRVKLLRPQIIAPVAASILAIVTVSLINFQNPQQERPLAAIDSPIVVSEETPVNQMILSEATKDPATAAQALNASDSEQEFLMDALANQLDGLSGEQVDTVFESLMEE